MLKSTIILILIICFAIIAIMILGIRLGFILDKPYSKFPQKTLDISEKSYYDKHYYKDFMYEWLERNGDWYYDNTSDTTRVGGNSSD